MDIIKKIIIIKSISIKGMYKVSNIPHHLLLLGDDNTHALKFTHFLRRYYIIPIFCCQLFLSIC